MSKLDPAKPRRTRASYRLAVATTALLALLAPATIASSASAAEARVGQVGLVTFTGAGLDSTGASLRFAWAPVPGAQKYEVFASSNFDQAKPDDTPNAVVTGTSATLKKLSPGKDYFVTVRAVKTNKDGKRNVGYSSARVGHGAITAQAKLPKGASQFKLITWNICSNACSGISTRTNTINKRIGELKPGIVTLQEASRYSKLPSGYGWAYKGQNSILYKSGEFSKVKASKGKPTAGMSRFGSKSASSGKGVAWAALRHKSGEYVLVLDAHLLVGSSKSAVAQRQYEASRLMPYANKVLSNLSKTHPKVTNWKNARVIVAGDMNTHKSRKGEKALAAWEKTGLYDAYDEAKVLSHQHFNSANPTKSLKPVIGITWGDHVDKVLVKPGRTVVHKWENAGKYANGRFVGPLGSDHHPVMVTVSLR